MKYNIIEWNINMRSNVTKDIPELIYNVIDKKYKNNQADIVVLTEFVLGRNSEDFFELLKNIGYDYSCTDCNSKISDGKNVNEVLIMWDRNKFELNESKEKFSNNRERGENSPDFLSLCLIDKKHGISFRIAGVRITINSNVKNYKSEGEHRYAQMLSVYKELDKITDENEKIVICGDFNYFRRNTTVESWNIGRLNCGKEEYSVFTPDGSSIDCINSNSDFPEDSFITKNCRVCDCKYERDFIEQNPQIYKQGEKLKGIPIGYPDHAILTGTIILEECV